MSKGRYRLFKITHSGTHFADVYVNYEADESGLWKFEEGIGPVDTGKGEVSREEGFSVWVDAALEGLREATAWFPVSARPGTLVLQKIRGMICSTQTGDVRTAATKAAYSVVCPDGPELVLSSDPPWSLSLGPLSDPEC